MFEKNAEKLVEGETCCVGCKVEGLITDLVESKDENDRKLSLYIKDALLRFNEDQERAKKPVKRSC